MIFGAGFPTKKICAGRGGGGRFCLCRRPLATHYIALQVLDHQRRRRLTTEKILMPAVPLSSKCKGRPPPAATQQSNAKRDAKTPRKGNADDIRNEYRILPRPTYINVLQTSSVGWLTSTALTFKSTVRPRHKSSKQRQPYHKICWANR